MWPLLCAALSFAFLSLTVQCDPAGRRDPAWSCWASGPSVSWKLHLAHHSLPAESGCSVAFTTLFILEAQICPKAVEGLHLFTSDLACEKH